ncbi:MAG: flagellar protein FliT, partial [Xanthobacteraceae bacterium]|nr:flagellar protein FliT [Xanthobacteraceae bacterium]
DRDCPGDRADGSPAGRGKHEMTSNAEYFARYEAIAAISRRMLTAARRALWNDLVHLQEEYRNLVDALKDAEAGVRLDDAERLRKYALIRQILADDAAIRDLANPRMANLSALFAGRPTRVLKELYGAR